MALSRRVVGKAEGLYFNPSAPIFASGSTLLDCALGGGWAQNRVINIVGDRSTGKTLLAIEAAANFSRQYPDAKIDYIEAEAAFDREYAKTVGFPDSANLIENMRTIEAIFAYLTKVEPGHRVVVIDSLDSVSDEKERSQELGDHGYGAAKPKLLSEAFRRLAVDLKAKNITLFIISQVRDNIGVMFGPKSARSGGRALDFYASQILWLNQTGKLEKVLNKVKRVMGIQVRAWITKNKIGPAYREAPLEILFNYGMDNVHACLYWLLANSPDTVKELGIPRVLHDYKRLHDKQLTQTLATLTAQKWREVEQNFTITAKKYDI